MTCSTPSCSSGTPVHPYIDGKLCETCRPLPPKPPRETTYAGLLERAGRSSSLPRVKPLLERASEPSVRPGRTATSYAAARKALPKSGTQRRRVLEALYAAYKASGGGATDVELAQHLDLGMNSVRPRRGELVDTWLVEDSGQTRTHYGSAHTVWRVTNAALAALHHRPE